MAAASTLLYYGRKVSRYERPAGRGHTFGKLISEKRDVKLTSGLVC